MQCLPRLSVLGAHFQKLTIDSWGMHACMCLDDTLSEVASACPHLTEVCILVFCAVLGLLTDAGLLTDVGAFDGCGARGVVSVAQAQVRQGPPLCE